MLPCNVILQETDDGAVEVAAIDPMASMQAIENSELETIDDQIRANLKIVIDNL